MKSGENALALNRRAWKLRRQTRQAKSLLLLLQPSVARFWIGSLKTATEWLSSSIWGMQWCLSLDWFCDFWHATEYGKICSKGTKGSPYVGCWLKKLRPGTCTESIWKHLKAVTVNAGSIHVLWKLHSADGLALWLCDCGLRMPKECLKNA